MCEIKTDEIERLVKLRREAEDRVSECAAQMNRYGFNSSADRDARTAHAAWACIKRHIEFRIIEALGGSADNMTEDGS